MDLYNKATTAPILKGNITQTSKVHSTVARYQDFRNANKTLKMQGVPIKTLKMQGNVNKTLKMRENDANTLKMPEYAAKTLKMLKHVTKNFDIARTCP